MFNLQSVPFQQSQHPSPCPNVALVMMLPRHPADIKGHLVMFSIIDYLMEPQMIPRWLGADQLVVPLVFLTLALLPDVLECIEVFGQTPESHHPKQGSRIIHGVVDKGKTSHVLHWMALRETPCCAGAWDQPTPRPLPYAEIRAPCLLLFRVLLPNTFPHYWNRSFKWKI
jgi:hypothetical protein